METLAWISEEEDRGLPLTLKRKKKTLHKYSYMYTRREPEMGLILENMEEKNKGIKE